MAAMNRFGEGGKGKIVLPAMRAVPNDLHEFAAHCNVTFAVSKTEWAGMNIFVEWVCELCEWLRDYRAQLGLAPDAVVVFFFDGVPAHISLTPLRLVREVHAICVEFVPHCTHIMQPIDVVWARFFKDLFTALYPHLIEGGVEERLDIANLISLHSPAFSFHFYSARFGRKFAFDS
jgi:hypothetical protein